MTNGEPKYAVPVTNINLCKNKVSTQYISKVIYIPSNDDKMKELIEEIEAIIVATNHIQRYQEAYNYVIYPMLEKSCGNPFVKTPLPDSLINKVLTVFVMEQGIPLPVYLSQQVKTEALLSNIIQDILDAARWLYNHRVQCTFVFHGDVRIDNLVYHNGRVKFIDYAPSGPGSRTQPDTEVEDLRDTLNDILKLFNKPPYYTKEKHTSLFTFKPPEFNQPEQPSRFMSRLKSKHMDALDSPGSSFTPPRFQKGPLFQEATTPSESPRASSKRPASTSPPERTPRFAKTLF